MDLLGLLSILLSKNNLVREDMLIIQQSSLNFLWNHSISKLCAFSSDTLEGADHDQSSEW